MTRRPVIIVCLCFGPEASAHADAVTYWNDVTLQLVTSRRKLDVQPVSAPSAGWTAVTESPRLGGRRRNAWTVIYA